MGTAAVAAVLLVACGGSTDDVAEKAADTAAKVEETVKTTTDEVVEAGTEVVEEATEVVEGVVEEGTEVVEEATEASSSSAQALVDQCVAEGETEEICNCQIGVVEEALGEDDFSTLVELAKNDDEAGAEKLMTDIMSEKPEVAMQMGMKMVGCAG